MEIKKESNKNAGNEKHANREENFNWWAYQQSGYNWEELVNLKLDQ